MKVTNKLLLIGLFALLFSFHSLPSAQVSDSRILVVIDEDTDYDINTDSSNIIPLSVIITERI